MPGVSLSDRTLFRQIKKIQKMPGPAGADGSDGAPGDPGSIITSGTAAPSGGSDIDVYLKKDADDVILKTYQKLSGTWTDIGDIQDPNAWTSFTPTVAAFTGTITAYTVTASYKLVGKSCMLRIQIFVSNNGTGSDYLVVGLPFAPLDYGYIGGYSMVADDNYTAIICNVDLALLGSTMGVSKYNNTYPCSTNGTFISLSGQYEIA